MPNEAEPIRNRKANAAAPESTTGLYDLTLDRMLSNLNYHDVLQREADHRALELRAWSRILRSDTLLALFVPRWKQ